VLVAQATGTLNANTALACALYFWSRLAHFVVYSMGIPVPHALAFFGRVYRAEVILALSIFKLI
jgi:uncharacterized MAPEG superfamily protein